MSITTRRARGYVGNVLSRNKFRSFSGGKWLLGWKYRKCHIINPSVGAGTNYQVSITVDFGSGVDTLDKVYVDGLCRPDFSDIRFTSKDGATLYNYWNFGYVASSSAVFWIKISDDLSINLVSIYIYYGRSNAITLSSGDDTFIWFDDIEVDLSKWTSWGLGLGVQSSAFAYTHTYSFETKSDATNYPRYYHRFGSALTNVALQVAFKDDASDTAAAYHSSWLYDGVGSGNRISIAISTPDTAQKYALLQSGWVNTNITRSTGWHVILYTVLSSGNTVSLDGTDLTSKWRDKASFGGIREIDIVTYNAANAFDGFADTYLLRKFVSPEPSHGEWKNRETC